MCFLGYLLNEEKEKLEDMDQLKKFTAGDDDGKYWMPVNWAFQLVIEARRSGYIKTDIWCCKLLEVKKLLTLFFFKAHNKL